ncbi:hypothetical protein J1N35_018772 [Gossypium stocksii]|uniref:Uncharacterized protein n=1 Tax=Gossypium stocksii TaxID=47602 RepID=A0A9D3VR53_9ROSI|nr:hypothetical protein J1N35_018772 [Gossypium stocksii]
MEKERKFRGRNLGNLSDHGNNCRDDLVQFYPILNFIPLGSGQSAHNKGLTKSTNMANQVLNEVVDGHGHMELQVVDENKSLHALEGKKRQCMVNDLIHHSGQLSNGEINGLSASSARQSSQVQ